MSRAFIQKRLPFKPTDIGGCKAWFDAYDASYTTIGNTVTAWTNKSGNANASTGAGTVNINQATLNGKSSVRFPTGTNYLNIGSISYSTSYRNQFFVVTVGASGSFYFYLNCNDVICGQCYSWNNGDIEINRSGLNGIVTSNPSGFFSSTSFVSICTSSGGNTGIWVNGSNQTLSINNVGTGGFWSTGTATGITLGGQNGFTTGNLDMYELLQYDGDLTTSQRQQIESYLAQKWGLRQQLPQGHPGTRGIVYPSDPVNVLVRVPYQSAFTPSVAGTVSMWLDGADPAGTGIKPSNGATVSTWIDKSGSGKNLTAVGTPTYVTASSSVYLNGGSYLQNTNFNFTNYTLFIVSVQASDQGPLYTNNTTTAGYSGFFPRYSNGNYYLVQSDGGWLSAGSPFANGTTYLYSIQYDSLNNIYLWSNGSISPVITGTAGTLTRNMFILGKRNVGGFQENMTGNVFEVVQYNSDLGQTSRQQVEGYLAWKWGLQANLPVNHPYKNAAPSITNQFGISRPPNVLPIPPITISARSKPTLQTRTFTYTGANQTFQVPATISPASITIYMWGAGGGGNTNYGGAGAMLQGVLTATPGETLNILVGQGGTIDGTTTFGGGGAGAGNMTSSGAGIGYSGNGFPQNAGSGGGRSAIQRGGTDPTNDIVVAGGGGGGTYFSSDRGGAATFSGTANSGAGGLPGLGGTQSAGGAGGGTGFYGQGLGGSRGIGGDTYNTNIYNGGGGGGGGYYGGGAGGTNGGDGAGGGGGSSLTTNLSLISGQSVLGFNSTNGYTAPNTGSPYYQSGVGNGAPAVNSSPRAGGNGLVVLTYNA